MPNVERAALLEVAVGVVEGGFKELLKGFVAHLVVGYVLLYPVPFVGGV